MFSEKVFLEISQNPQENTCASVSFLIKLQDWPATLLKKRLWHRCFPVNFVKFLRTPFLTEHLWWLLIYFKTRCWFNHFLKNPCLFSNRQPVDIIATWILKSSYWMRKLYQSSFVITLLKFLVFIFTNFFKNHKALTHLHQYHHHLVSLYLWFSWRTSKDIPLSSLYHRWISCFSNNVK